MFLSSLDFFYYEMASTINAAGDSDAKKSSDLLRYEADTKNIMTILRLKRGNADKSTIMKHVARGGRLSRAQLEKIAAAKDMNEALSLSTSVFRSQTGRTISQRQSSSSSQMGSSRISRLYLSGRWQGAASRRSAQA